MCAGYTRFSGQVPYVSGFPHNLLVLVRLLVHADVTTSRDDKHPIVSPYLILRKRLSCNIFLETCHVLCFFLVSCFPPLPSKGNPCIINSLSIADFLRVLQPPCDMLKHTLFGRARGLSPPQTGHTLPSIFKLLCVYVVL